MTPASDHLPTPTPHAINSVVAAGENPAVDPCVRIPPDQTGMPDIQADKVGGTAFRQFSLGPQCLRAPGQARPENGTAAALSRFTCKPVAAVMLKPLAIFQQAHLFRRVDQYVGVAADTVIASRVKKAVSRENPVSEVGLRDGTESCHRSAPRHGFGFVVRHVRCMHQTPAIGQWDVIQQPFDRPRAGPGDTVFHFLHLLRNMNMDRRVMLCHAADNS